MRWKIPPVVKVYEALGCIADRHVRFIKDDDKGKAIVTSSMGSRRYKVLFHISKNQITSDDNGSKWRGYLGYPSIAVLMLKGVLPFDSKLSNALRRIKWYNLNKKFKDYTLTIKEAQRIAGKRKISKDKLEKFINKVIEEIKKRKFEKYIDSTKSI